MLRSTRFPTTAHFQSLNNQQKAMGSPIIKAEHIEGKNRKRILLTAKARLDPIKKAKKESIILKKADAKSVTMEVAVGDPQPRCSP